MTMNKENEIVKALLELWLTVDKELEPELAESIREAIFFNLINLN